MFYLFSQLVDVHVTMTNLVLLYLCVNTFDFSRFCFTNGWYQKKKRDFKKNSSIFKPLKNE